MKTKLGIAVGLFGAAIYFTFCFGGYTPFFILAAYVLFKEDNEWLRRVVLKAFIVGMLFDFASKCIGLIPDAISLLNSFTGIFNKSLRIPFLSNIASFLRSAVYLIEAVIFILLGVQAIKMQDFPISFADKLVDEALGSTSKVVEKVKEKVSNKPAEEAAPEKTEENK